MQVRLKDTDYAYHVEGKGPPLLLLHGFTGSKRTWERSVQKWKSSFTCITIDLPGHGDKHIDKPRTMELCCQDLKAFLNYLEIGPVHILGYSMRGRAALSFALLYPESVSSLILESSTPGLKTKQERNERIKRDENLAVRIEEEGLQSFVAFWEKIPLFETQLRLPKEVRRKVREERLNQSPAGLASSLRYMGTGMQPNWWDDLQSINIPVLLIVGAEDKKFKRINYDMMNLLKKSQIQIVENAGHAIHVEQLDIFGKLVTSFIKQQEKHTNNLKEDL